jgi:hypothetical protein
VTSSEYSASSRDFSIRGNFIVDAGDVIVHAANSNANYVPLFCSFTSNVMYRSALRHVGPCDLAIINNVIKTKAGQTQAEVSYQVPRFGRRFTQSSSVRLQLMNNVFSDEDGSPRITLSDIRGKGRPDAIVDISGNNFTIEKDGAVYKAVTPPKPR